MDTVTLNELVDLISGQERLVFMQSVLLWLNTVKQIRILAQLQVFAARCLKRRPTCRCWECAWACRHWRWRTVQPCSTPRIQCTATCPASPTAGTHCLRAFHQVSGTHHGRSVRRYISLGAGRCCAWVSVIQWV
jgi:hypothetical protein